MYIQPIVERKYPLSTSILCCYFSPMRACFSAVIVTINAMQITILHIQNKDKGKHKYQRIRTCDMKSRGKHSYYICNSVIALYSLGATGKGICYIHLGCQRSSTNFLLPRIVRKDTANCIISLWYRENLPSGNYQIYDLSSLSEWLTLDFLTVLDSKNCLDSIEPQHWVELVIARFLPS